jgi:hypothetical protein
MLESIQGLLPGVALPAVLSLVILLLAMTPVVSYVLVGWRAKRKDIVDSLSPAVCLLYFQAFSSRTAMPKDADGAKRAFDQLYSRWYGRRFFIIPTLVYFLTMLLAVSLTVFSLARLTGPASGLFRIASDPTVAALAGAFMWCVNDQISRARRLDFSPSDMLWSALRMVIAIPLGYSFDALVSPSLAGFIAFALGAFPLSTLQVMLRRMAARHLGTEDTAQQASDKIICLQGIDTDIVERLRQEDITTITELAYCDPVRLTMRSNLTFSFVTDAMSQALAWLYLEDKLTLLRPIGLRGAIEFRHFAEDLLYEGTDELRLARQRNAVASFGTMLRLLCYEPGDEPALRMMLSEISGDPFTIFVSGVWDDTGLD